MDPIPIEPKFPIFYEAQFYIYDFENSRINCFYRTFDIIGLKGYYSVLKT